jgi:hypothetical protein
MKVCKVWSYKAFHKRRNMIATHTCTHDAIVVPAFTGVSVLGEVVRLRDWSKWQKPSWLRYPP